jgi:hypothetical protein
MGDEMTLAELRQLADSVSQIPCGDPGECDEEILEYNASVGRFRELVVKVRNQLMASPSDEEPDAATALRLIAEELASRHRHATLPWACGAPAEPGALPSRRR